MPCKVRIIWSVFILKNNRMTFLESVKAELPALEKAELNNCLIIIRAFLDNPETRLFVSITKLVDKISQEINSLADAEVSTDAASILGILKGDGKVFERINTIIMKYGEYCQMLRDGRQISGVKEEEIADGKDDSDFLSGTLAKIKKS